MALGLANDVGMPVPVGGLVRQIYQSGRAVGLGRKDFSVMGERNGEGCWITSIDRIDDGAS
ncbi:MAG: hypothetical protein CM1200mP41_36470 [Gammaproteobacteria bacterium]|nr:MAG: hypothetical protein CM1200mP41_36470 [Gammaproteobacteria bacterium]